MNIQGIKSFQVNPYYQNQVIAKSGKGKNGNAEDKILISQEAKMLQGVSSFEKERAERVAKITEGIRSGQYKPNPEGIAHSLMRFYRG